MSDMSEREVELRKYEARIGLWKTGILSAVVAIATAVINYQISLRQVELEEQKAKNANALETQKQENAYLAQFVVNAMDEDLEKRIRFADYFATLTLSQERRQRWVE